MSFALSCVSIAKNRENKEASIIAIHSPAATYSINFCRERVGDFHLCCVTKQAAESHPLKGLDQSVRNILLTFNNCIVLLYRQWVVDSRKISMEEMIELTTTLLENRMKVFRGK